MPGGGTPTSNDQTTPRIVERCRLSRTGSTGHDVEVLLDGIRVLDLTQYLSGPSATRLLAALGADVIKVEPGPLGDGSRALPVVRDGRSAYYVQQNRGKRSIGVDFGSVEAHALLADLAGRCDVVAENFGAGVLERRGLDYPTMSARHPSLIMVSISAFGRTGPFAGHPGYDLIGQAMSGMMHLTGEPDGPPQFAGSPISDCASGMFAFAAVGHALYHRERTGRGQYIDVSMVDSLFHMHSIAVQAPSVDPSMTQTRTGRTYDVVVPSGSFRTSDGWLVLQCLDPQWNRFCTAMGRPDLEHDPRYADAAARVANRETLVPIIDEWIGSFPSSEAALAVLAEHRIPAAPVIDPADAADHPYFTGKGMVRQAPDPILGPVTVPGFPIGFSDRTDPDTEPEAPFLGQHNEAVLAELLGYTPAQVDDLTARGILVTEPRPT